MNFDRLQFPLRSRRITTDAVRAMKREVIHSLLPRRLAATSTRLSRRKASGRSDLFSPRSILPKGAQLAALTLGTEPHLVNIG
jgi:hypothetical protein